MATSQATAVDIGKLLDKQKLSLFHLGTFLLCVRCLWSCAATPAGTYAARAGRIAVTEHEQP